MIHAEKICPSCDEPFTPAEHLNEIQAEQTNTCSTACSSAMANGGRKRADHNVRGVDIRTCVCADCSRIREADRSALIAEVAASHGVPVATGPRVPRTREQAQKLFAKAYRNRKSYLESLNVMVME